MLRGSDPRALGGIDQAYGVGCTSKEVALARAITKAPRTG